MISCSSSYTFAPFSTIYNGHFHSRPSPFRGRHWIWIWRGCKRRIMFVYLFQFYLPSLDFFLDLNRVGRDINLRVGEGHNVFLTDIYFPYFFSHLFIYSRFMCWILTVFYVLWIHQWTKGTCTPAFVAYNSNRRRKHKVDEKSMSYT